MEEEEEKSRLFI